MNVKIKGYPIVSILWEDHIDFRRSTIPDKIDLIPVLTVGVIVKKTKKYLIVAYNIERYETHDEADFIIIVRSAILGIKKYGKIKINALYFEGAE